MVARREFGNSSGVRGNRDAGGGVRKDGDKLRRGASVSGEPIDHPGVRLMVAGLPGTAVGVSSPVGVSETSGVHVVRIARVGVLERRLREGETQDTGTTQMKPRPHSYPILTQFKKP